MAGMGASWDRPRLPGDVFIDGGASIEENDDPDYGGRDEHLGVHAQPGEVQADLLPKVLPALRAKQRDKLTHSAPLGDKSCPRPCRVPSPAGNSSNWPPGSREWMGL